MLPQRADSPAASVAYAIEKGTDCIFEIARHAKAHWEEFGSRKDIRTFEVDANTYLQADRMGRLTLATARCPPDDRLIGYLLMLHRPDLHAKGTVTAESAFYYVEKRPMRGLVQRNLIRCMRDNLLSRGIRHQKIRFKIEQSNESILRNCGFEPDEMVFTLKG